MSIILFEGALRIFRMKGNMLKVFTSLLLIVVVAVSAQSEYCDNFSGQLKGLCQAYCVATACGNSPSHASNSACLSILAKITPLVNTHNAVHNTRFLIDENSCGYLPSCIPDGQPCNITDCQCCSGQCNGDICEPTKPCHQSCIDVIDMAFQSASGSGTIYLPTKSSCQYGALNLWFRNATNYWFNLGISGNICYLTAGSEEDEMNLIKRALPPDYDALTMQHRCVELAQSRYDAVIDPDCSYLCKHHSSYP